MTDSQDKTENINHNHRRYTTMFRGRFQIKVLLVMSMVALLGIFIGIRGPAAESFYLPVQGDGFGTLFKQNEITVSSDAEVILNIASAEEHLVDLTVSGDTEKVTLTVQGLSPSALYYVYLDDFSNPMEYTTSEDGALSVSVALVEAFPELPNLRHLMIQDEQSTLFLRDDAAGGDCASIGTWNAATKTCTLTQTVTETLQIDADAITLDCNNQILQKGNGYYAVYVPNNDDITLKNCIIQGAWSKGIYIYSSHRATIIDNVLDGTIDGIEFWFCDRCQFLRNTISNGVQFGFTIGWAVKNSLDRPQKVTDNTIVNTRYGWHWAGSWIPGTCIDEFYNNRVDGKEVLYLCRAESAVVENTDAYATIGVFYSNYITISNVTFPGGNAQSVFLQDVTNSVVEHIDTGVLETNVGIQVKDSVFESQGRSDNITIRNNNIRNAKTGIRTTPPSDNKTHNCLLESNVIVGSEASTGIALGGEHCEIVANDISGNGNGLYALGPNRVEGNNIHNNEVGLLAPREGSVYQNNTISENIYNIDFGLSPTMPLSRLDFDFDESNLVEGKTVLILKNPIGQTVTGDWAMILVHGGDNVTIEGATTANNNRDSIALVQTDNSTIIGATVGMADRGIHIAGGQNNQILNNTFIAPVSPYPRGEVGILLNSSSGNRVANNPIESYFYGISLKGPYNVNNTVVDNVLTGGEIGIKIEKNLSSTGTVGMSNNNVIANNDITARQQGIRLQGIPNIPPPDNMITGNLVTENVIHDVNYFGLALYNASENTITSNLFYGQGTLSSRGDIFISSSSATDNKVIGNDFFSGISTLSSNMILCDPNTSGGVGNFYDRSVPAERSPFGPCGIADVPFTEGGNAMSWQAVEQCRDGRDNDGDGAVDLADLDCSGNLYTELEGIPCTDADGDGYAYNGGECGPVDCNDTNAEINPGAQEICLDNQDNNCDGQIDECTAEENVQALIEKLQTDEVAKGTENSLVTKLDNAIKSLDKENPSTALNQLAAFENEVEAQRGKHLTEEQADYLLQVVATIRAVIEVEATP